MNQPVSAVDLSDIDLSSIDLFDVEILQAADTMGVPETGASPSVVYSCSCSGETIWGKSGPQLNG